METTILELITKYGLNTFIIASIIFVLTGLIKKPIKWLAKKMQDGTCLTKYITILPILLGFGITVLYTLIFKNDLIFDGNFFTLWLTSSSLSLALYAFIEKFIPSKNKILSAIEIKQNEEIIEKIKEIVMPAAIIAENIETAKHEEQIDALHIEKQPLRRIILKGNRSEQSAGTENNIVDEKKVRPID